MQWMTLQALPIGTSAQLEPPHPVGFHPPRNPQNKCKWGILRAYDRFSSVGVIIKDCNGQVVAALCKPLEACYSAELTEVIALEKGFLLAQELQLPRVIFESDSLTAIQAINDKAIGNNYGHLMTSRESFRPENHLRLASSST
uniref:RNase H type-1 domain-containing protein n=1 Tax=Quercus lobata TaxID=97700 RepID=A0A7N2LNU2_QUELO